ncbi:MAG: dihydrofolate reductase [Candidatus Moraniibacteriota bacterium]
MISIIAVVGKNRAIGRNNQLLWKIPEDMKHFQEKTLGKTVVMGERTFLSIGKPLLSRKNIVVTLDPAFKAKGVEIEHSLEELLEKAKKSPEEIFIIGGGQIYSKSLPHADKLYLTVVDDAPADADTFFPDYSEFSREVHREERINDQHKFTFLELTRKI